MGASARKRFAPEPADPFDDQLKQRRRGRLSGRRRGEFHPAPSISAGYRSQQARETAGRLTCAPMPQPNHQKET
jgi:hypothetical protein